MFVSEVLKTSGNAIAKAQLLILIFSCFCKGENWKELSLSQQQEQQTEPIYVCDLIRHFSKN